MKEPAGSRIAALLLILLFTYTAVSKWAGWEEFNRQMDNQAFSAGIARAVTLLLPPAELLTALLLAWRVSRPAGLIAAAILLSVFTLYTGLVLLHVFPRVPCSCGGVLKAMGWRVHFLFNLAFLALTATGIYQTSRKEVKNN